MKLKRRCTKTTRIEAIFQRYKKDNGFDPLLILKKENPAKMTRLTNKLTSFERAAANHELTWQVCEEIALQ